LPLVSATCPRSAGFNADWLGLVMRADTSAIVPSGRVRSSFEAAMLTLSAGREFLMQRRTYHGSHWIREEPAEPCVCLRGTSSAIHPCLTGRGLQRTPPDTVAVLVVERFRARVRRWHARGSAGSAR